MIKDIENRMSQLTDNKFVFEGTINGNVLEFSTEMYYKFQDKGVKGTVSGSSKEGYSFSEAMPPPSAFSKYASSTNAQFAIAKSIQQKGIKAHNYTDKISNDSQILDMIANLYIQKI